MAEEKSGICFMVLIRCNYEIGIIREHIIWKYKVFPAVGKLSK